MWGTYDTRELLGALVCRNNGVGVEYVSLLIGTIPIWILRKKATEDFTRRASRGGQSKSSNLSTSVVAFGGTARKKTGPKKGTKV